MSNRIKTSASFTMLVFGFIGADLRSIPTVRGIKCAPFIRRSNFLCLSLIVSRHESMGRVLHVFFYLEASISIYFSRYYELLIIFFSEFMSGQFPAHRGVHPSYFPAASVGIVLKSTSREKRQWEVSGQSNF